MTKKYYKLKWHHFKDILKLVEEGYYLEIQNDMLEKVRLDLYIEEQQLLEMHRKDPKLSLSNVPAIYIMLPESLYQSAYLGPSSTTSLTSAPFKYLDISGPRDKLTDEYFFWQESQVKGLEQKAAYQEACKVIKDLNKI